MDDCIQTLPQTGKMRTDAHVICDEEHWQNIDDQRTLQQIRNTAALPGIVGSAWAMADWHHGYGFPIGGVVASEDSADGIVSPGGVGFDINCGVRMLATGLDVNDLSGRKKQFADILARTIPAGPSGKGGVSLTPNMLDDVLANGAKAAVEEGWSYDLDLERLEDHGVMEGTGEVSERARERGLRQLGTLGSGNHFLEVQVVDAIHDITAAERYGLHDGQIVVMIHSGSRGLGHQVCTDALADFERAYSKEGDHWRHKTHNLEIQDRQLAAEPVESEEGCDYIAKMRAAANFAFANRSVLSHRLRDALKQIFGKDTEAEVVYDVAHNIVRRENHAVDGEEQACWVHRKGATRARGGNHPTLESFARGVGQPVLVPGDMGNASWVLAGPERGENIAFGSSCHGAGRRLSRTAARAAVDAVELKQRLADKGIIVRARSEAMLSEEAPSAYKDVDDVIELTERAGLARKVARMRPQIVIKG
ncbi:MAG: RNA-splicing ligase RtcB [Euryarchaeota archaeon]|nr:RNA-splicing ligase RtcB [Euryarchaeota archaeon]